VQAARQGSCNGNQRSRCKRKRKQYMNHHIAQKFACSVLLMLLLLLLLLLLL
jgi:hypothetical protein